MESSLNEGLIESGISLEHRQTALLGRLPTSRIHLDYQHRNGLQEKLFGNLPANAAIPAKNHMVVHTPQVSAKPQLPQLAEVSRFCQAKNLLNRELHHHDAPCHDQNRHQPSGLGEGLHFAITNGADRDQHHPQAITPVPTLRDPIPDSSAQNHNG